MEELLRLEDAPVQEFVSITLNDEDGLYRPKDQLEERYRRILEVRLDNARVRHKLEHTMSSEEQLTPFEAFQEFYQEMKQSGGRTDGTEKDRSYQRTGTEA